MLEKGQIVDKRELLSASAHAREQYENLIVAAFPGTMEEYCIGVELDDGRVLVVDHASERSVRERIQNWAGQVEDIKRQYRFQHNPT